MGNPWVMDACEIAYKNRNVYVDISGLEEGDPTKIESSAKNHLLVNFLKTGLDHLDDYKKVLFGTDWPIVPMQAYIDFCKKLIPEHTYEDVFLNNALQVYGISLDS